MAIQIENKQTTMDLLTILLKPGSSTIPSSQLEMYKPPFSPI